MLTHEDRSAIYDLINRYHYYVDEPGFPRMREVFTEDCIFDVSDYGGGISRGMDALAARFSTDSGVLAHSCTNVIISGDAAGPVRCISKCLALLPEGKMGVAIHTDVLRRTPQGWRIAERVLSMPSSLKRK